MNINLLKINEREVIADVLDLFSSGGFFPQITLPTRFSTHSCTLIDNIYCKLSEYSPKNASGIFISPISDHLPCFSSISTCKKPFDPHFVV